MNILRKRKILLEYTTEEATRKEQENEYINTDLNLPFAHSLGLLQVFHPCLMAILGFLLSFTAGTSNSAKSGMIRATVFGLGLVGSYLVLGLCLLSFRKSISRFGKLFFCYRHCCNSYRVKPSGDLKITRRSG